MGPTCRSRPVISNHVKPLPSSSLLSKFCSLSFHDRISGNSPVVIVLCTCSLNTKALYWPLSSLVLCLIYFVYWLLHLLNFLSDCHSPEVRFLASVLFPGALPSSCPAGNIVLDLFSAFLLLTPPYSHLWVTLFECIAGSHHPTWMQTPWEGKHSNAQTWKGDGETSTPKEKCWLSHDTGSTSREAEILKNW